MPLLNITGHGHLIPLAYYVVLSVLLWPRPEDEAARENFILHHHARLDAGREKSNMHRVVSEAFSRSYADIPAERRFGIAASGQILRRVRELAHTEPERASVNRAIDDLVNLDARIQTAARQAGKRPVRPGFYRARLWDVWGEWRPSAHLAAAFCDWRQDRSFAESRINPFNRTTLIHFLARSEWYREFGEHHIPPHAAKFRRKGIVTLLDPSESWRLPPDLELPVIEVPSLSEL